MVYILFNLLQPPHTPLFTHNVLNLAFIPSQSRRNISSKIICWISRAFHNQVIKASADCFIFFQSIINVTIFFILNNENKRYVKLVGKVFSESFVNDYGVRGLSTNDYLDYLLRSKILNRGKEIVNRRKESTCYFNRSYFSKLSSRGFLTEKLFSKKDCRPWSINVGLRSNPKDACLKAVHVPLLYIKLNTIQIWIQSRIDYILQHSETWVKKQSYSQQKMCFTSVDL